MERISTNIRMLDHHLGGGIPVGSITALVSPPASQVNPLFYALMGERSWLYLSTYRSERAVSDELDELLWGDVDIEFVGVERPARRTHEALQRTDEDRHVIVDTMNPLEKIAHESRYVDLLNGLKEYLLDHDRVAVCHCTRLCDPPPLRESTLTVADMVWKLDTTVEKQGIENTLIVPKHRSRETVEDVIKLDLGEEAAVDASRNVA
ncbi:RAD55 family ATPase [Salinirubellus sp. GCM10025818]|jgi:KaiC/GvpD/RAD55 family RecA-like ATPase|uniref:RAD55 family ATPase n=1 Tax=Salinirubellus TaxID=2162630 RepID=UPI0030CBF727